METKTTTTTIPMDAVRLAIASHVLSGLCAGGRDGANSIHWLCERALTYADELISICVDPKDNQDG